MAPLTGQSDIARGYFRVAWEDGYEASVDALCADHARSLAAMKRVHDEGTTTYTGSGTDGDEGGKRIVAVARIGPSQ